MSPNPGIFQLPLAQSRGARQQSRSNITLGSPSGGSPPRVDDRRVIGGIVHVLKSGGRWIDATVSYWL